MFHTCLTPLEAVYTYIGGLLHHDTEENNSIDHRLPALAYSDAALSKSGFHFVRLVFKLEKNMMMMMMNI